MVSISSTWGRGRASINPCLSCAPWSVIQHSILFTVEDQFSCVGSWAWVRWLAHARSPNSWGHGSSIHHADRNMALSHATQDLLDPPLKLNDLDKETQVPPGPNLWGSWNQHLLHRWVQEPEPGDSSPLDPLSQGSWTQHSGYHLLFLYYSVSLNIIPKTRSVRASSFHFCLFWKAFILA